WPRSVERQQVAQEVAQVAENVAQVDGVVTGAGGNVSVDARGRGHDEDEVAVLAGASGRVEIHVLDRRDLGPVEDEAVGDGADAGSPDAGRGDVEKPPARRALVVDIQGVISNHAIDRHIAQEIVQGAAGIVGATEVEYVDT